VPHKCKIRRNKGRAYKKSERLYGSRAECTEAAQDRREKALEDRPNRRKGEFSDKGGSSCIRGVTNKKKRGRAFLKRKAGEIVILIDGISSSGGEISKEYLGEAERRGEKGPRWEESGCVIVSTYLLAFGKVMSPEKGKRWKEQ